MAERKQKLVLLPRVRFWWYLPALVPIVALVSCLIRRPKELRQ
jgi:hypothetical protein